MWPIKCIITVLLIVWIFIVCVQGRIWSAFTGNLQYLSYFSQCIMFLFSVTCSGTVCVFRFCGHNSVSMMIHYLYSCLQISVTLLDMTIIRLLGHIMQIMQYRMSTYSVLGHVMAHLVEALCCKPEGGKFDSQWYHWNFSLT